MHQVYNTRSPAAMVLLELTVFGQELMRVVDYQFVNVLDLRACDVECMAAIVAHFNVIVCFQVG
jgi:hypothetical protein